MSELPKCPECGSEYTDEDRDSYISPECAHGWTAGASETIDPGLVVKVGTKVRNIRLVHYAYGLSIPAS